MADAKFLVQLVSIAKSVVFWEGRSTHMFSAKTGSIVGNDMMTA